MSKPIVDTGGNKYEWIDRNTGQKYTIFAKNKTNAERQLALFLEKIGKIELIDNLEIC